ncbi:MAG: ATP-binding protein [Hyphomonas sp.]
MQLNILTTPVARLAVPALLTAAVLLAIVYLALRPEAGAAGWRAPWEVPFAIWAALGVGVGSCLISGGVWALKPADPATILFALSGFATLLFCAGAAASLVPVPLSYSLLLTAATVNALGASAFGIVMICLFLIYPKRLPGWRIFAGLAVGGFGLWTAAYIIWPWRQFEMIQPITLAEMVLIVGLVLAQIAATRDDPAARAIAVWLGASVITGAGFFIATVAAPITFGFPPLVPPIYAFASFLLIYIGLAAGLLRYRVFGLGVWAFQLVFHLAALLCILIFDAAFIGLLSLDSGTAFTASLLLAALLYLPLRGFAWQWVTGRGEPEATDVFRAVIDTVLRPGSGQRATSWEALLKRVFRPLEISPGDSLSSDPAIAEDGLLLQMPAVTDAPAFSLRYKREGRALFSPRDLALAEQMVALVRHAEESRGAYDRGVVEERARIARDIHDNIGAQLLRALHSREAGRKDAMIRETLTDIRDVINNAEGFEAPLEDVLADLRAETADRLDPHGITLVWSITTAPGARLDRKKIHALRAMIREAVSNTIKHSGAKQVQVEIALRDNWVTLTVTDDGCGLPVVAAPLGNGLANMKVRVESLGGEISLIGAGGTCLTARIPASELDGAAY